MTLDIVNAGIYVSHFPAWVNAASAYSDFAWLVAISAWTLAGILWHRSRKPHHFGAWQWLPASIATSVVGTTIHVAHLVFSRVQGSPNGPFLYGDMALGVVVALLSAAWWWSALAGSRHRWWSCALLLVLLLACAAWRYDFFQAGYPSWILSLAAVAAAVPWLFHPRATPASRVAVLAGSLLPLCSTVGPVAYEFSMMERYTVLSPAALWAGTAQAVVALLTVALLARDVLAILPGRREFLREVQPFLLGGMLWAFAMLSVAWLVGERQRRRTEERALEQTRLAATLFNPAVLAPFRDERWRLDEIPLARVRNNPIRTGWSDYLATDAAHAAVQAFEQVAKAARNAVYVRFVTFSTGWFAAPINHRTPREGFFRRLTRSVGPKDGRVLLLREVNAEDRRRWDEKAEVIEGPTVGRMMGNGHVFVRAPLFHSGGQMAGWLEFTFTADDFLSETIQARIAPLTGMLLGVVVTALIFGQQREARAREAARREAAVAAESSRVKTDFLAKVSHELRTPLQSLLGYGEMLGREPLSPSARKQLGAQRLHGEIMLRLVNDLLDLSAIEAGSFSLVERPVSLEAVVNDAVESLRERAAAKGLVLHCAFAPRVPAWVRADDVRLRQVVLNLVGNAVKFTERGGVDVRVTYDADTMELVVRDTGPGIAPADQARLFQPFSRLDLTAQHEGTRLGLALAAALCRRAGGDLTVTSDGRSGSCFRATWAVRECAPPEKNSAEPTPALPPLLGRCVLVAEDNPLIGQLFSAQFEELGAECVVVETGPQALEFARKQTWDVLILDVALPGMDGFAVARQLRQEGRGRLRIVGVSAHASVEAAASGQAAGMDAFLAKPVTLVELVAAAFPEQSSSAGPGSDLRARIQHLFRQDAGRQGNEVAMALATRDWDLLRRRAHYLKGSAGVVGDSGLYAACGDLEAAAMQGNEVAAQSAWASCLAALNRWSA